MSNLKFADYRACADAGMTMPEAANHLGVAYQNVAGMAIRGGLKFVTARTDRSAEYAEHAADGLTARETAKKMGVSYDAVQKAKKRLGLVFKRQGREKKAPPKTKPAPVNRVVFSASPKAISRYLEGVKT